MLNARLGRTRRTALRATVIHLAVIAVAPAFAQELTGDRVATSEGPLTIQPISHATFAMSWNDVVVYNDPVGGASAFEGLPGPDLILISDIHGDHLDAETLSAVATSGTRIVAPAAVAEQLPENLRASTSVLDNGETTAVMGVAIEAVPMYNLTEERMQYHDKGRGNGYVLGFADTRVYISGDTEDIPEMRALDDIDVAFICFNLPYTMTEQQAASAVREFSPDIVYPYHYRGSSFEEFEQLVGEAGDIEVRQGDWY